jgi:hypothetical protein
MFIERYEGVQHLGNRVGEHDAMVVGLHANAHGDQSRPQMILIVPPKF